MTRVTKDGECTTTPLAVYENGNPDWVVAHDERDAIVVYCEALGEDPAKYGPATEDDWERLPDDRVVTLWMKNEKLCGVSEPGGVAVPWVCRDIITKWGRGFFATVDS